MKRCFKCGSVKPLEEFHKHPQMADGHLNMCITCRCEYQRAYYAEHREQCAEYAREWVQRAENKARRREYLRALRLRHPDKNKARQAVARALRRGKLVRQPCRICGGRAQAHHEDYSRPLDVRWLCFAHHRAEHGQVVIQ